MYQIPDNHTTFLHLVHISTLNTTYFNTAPLYMWYKPLLTSLSGRTWVNVGVGLGYKLFKKILLVFGGDLPNGVGPL